MSTDDNQKAKDDANQNADDRVTVEAFVDRIEEDLAVILFNDGGQLDTPLRYLPPGTSAGDHLKIIFQLDPESRAATMRNISELRRQLTEDNDPQQTEFKL